MKKTKNNLDEMQEQELLKIEHNGCWLAFWGLMIAMAVQIITVGYGDFRVFAGEFVVFMVLAVYIAIACARRGIWDRRIPMNTRANLMVSAIAAIAAGVFNALTIFKNYKKPVGSIAAALITATITFVLCFAALTFTMKQTEKRQKKLDEEPADEDE